LRNPDRPIFKQTLEETLSSLSDTVRLEKDIDHLTILVDSPPQVLLFTINFDKYFINVERIAKSVMSTFQSFGILGAEFVAPQTNRFIAYGNTACIQRLSPSTT